MKVNEKVAVIFLVLLIAAAWGFAYEKYESIVDETVALSPGGTVSLENINGDVTIEVWDRDEVRVYALKTASSQELLDALKVEINPNPASVQIDTEYPSSRGYRDDGSDHNERAQRHMKVEYTLTVPRWAVIDDVDLVNGSLMITGVQGGIDAETVNGDIVVREAAGNASLATVNGGIELYVDQLGNSDGVDLEAVNGSIDLYLGSSVGADIRAESVNGTLANDLGIEVTKGKYVGSSFNGSIGGGGSRVDLETVNGSVTVHSW
ncbi:MAG: hypothetical protein QNL88_12750 [Acidobacteriota bacterium]|nr:hypothetical protein [Acidobacteriota bacterium]